MEEMFSNLLDAVQNVNRKIPVEDDVLLSGGLSVQV